MNFTIKQVKPTRPDVHKLLTKLHKVCFPADDMPDFTEGFWWISYANKTPVGFCGMRSSLTWQETGFMTRAGVIPGHRGKGLQKRLIAVRVAKAKRLNWKYILTYTHDNCPSANNLIDCGFKLYDPRNPFAADGSLYWRRKLVS